MVDKIERYYNAQSWLAKNSEIYSLPLEKAFESFTRKISDVMNLKLCSVWMMSFNQDVLTEKSTYWDGLCYQGKVSLSKREFPYFFKLLEKERTFSLASSDLHPDLVSFYEKYLKNLDILSATFSPIYSDGTIIGMIMCGTIDHKRSWDIEDRIFLASGADFTGRLIEAEVRLSTDKQLRRKIDYLESDLMKKLDDLKEAKLSLDLALEGARAGKWFWDIKTGQLNLNESWYTKLGYEYNELPQVLETFKKLIHPDDLEATFTAINKHLRGETALYECRFRMLTKSGEIQWCLDRGCISKRSEAGEAISLSGVNINITPLVQLEQSLIRSQQQLEAMIRSVPAPVAMFDKNLRYLAFSTNWEQEWSKFGPIVLGQKMNFDKLANLEVWTEKMNDALKGMTGRRDEDLIQAGPDVQVWLRWVVQPWLDSNGDVGGVILMAEDITDRKQAQMRMTQASKLSALGEMAGGIAHEINNPLSIIKGYIDLLKRHARRKSLNENLMLKYIDKMDFTVDRISRIVNGMRRFSREGSQDEKQPYSLNKIIDETLDICLERINNSGTSVNIEHFESDALVFCRPVEISQVLLNLINNSFHATYHLSHPWIKIKCIDHSDKYEIRLIDSGEGVPLSIRSKLFQPFFTTKDIGIGTGLGLSISKGIIEEHMGHLVYVEDSVNTTFSITLPKLSREDK